MAKVRVQFFDVDGLRAVELVAGGIEFSGKIRCEADELTKAVTDKVALLNTAGYKQKVKTIGKRVSDDIYYVVLNTEEWEELREAISSARQRRLAQSI